MSLAFFCLNNDARKMEEVSMFHRISRFLFDAEMNVISPIPHDF